MVERVGSVEVVPLTDGVGELGELAELYPEVSADEWKPFRQLYPELFVESRWRLPMTCFLIRAGQTILLVDTGVGPPGLWDWEPEWEGGLLPALAENGVEPRDVDAVFFTHFHTDHVGWNTDADGVAVFPRARFLAHAKAIEVAKGEGAGRPHIRRCVLPLVEAGAFDELTGEAELAPGVTAVPLPGHAVGHMGVRIASDGEEALLIADAAVHPALLDEPDWRYLYDFDHERSSQTRRELVAEVAGEDVLVACGHYPGAIGRVVRRDGRVVWEPV